MAEQIVNTFAVCTLVVALIIIGVTMIKVRRTGNSAYMPKFHAFGKIGWTIVLIAAIFGALALCSTYITLP